MINKILFFLHPITCRYDQGKFRGTTSIILLLFILRITDMYGDKSTMMQEVNEDKGQQSKENWENATEMKRE